MTGQKKARLAPGCNGLADDLADRVKTSACQATSRDQGIDNPLFPGRYLHVDSKFWFSCKRAANSPYNEKQAY
jgi:hypothetical protein